MGSQEEEGNVGVTGEVVKISHEVGLVSYNDLFLRSLDEWIHLVVSHEEIKGVSFANGKREDVKNRILNSYCNTLQASIDFYIQMSQITSKQGYEKEAQRYRLIAEIFESIRCQNDTEVKRRTFDE